jgi:hypothetical protein
MSMMLALSVESYRSCVAGPHLYSECLLSASSNPWLPLKLEM